MKKIPLFDSKYHHGANCLLILPSDSMFWVFCRFLSFFVVVAAVVVVLIVIIVVGGCDMVVLLQFFFFTRQCLHFLARLPLFRAILLPIPFRAVRSLCLFIFFFLVLLLLLSRCPYSSPTPLTAEREVAFVSAPSNKKHFYFARIYIYSSEIVALWWYTNKNRLAYTEYICIMYIYIYGTDLLYYKANKTRTYGPHTYKHPACNDINVKRRQWENVLHEKLKMGWRKQQRQQQQQQSHNNHFKKIMILTFNNNKIKRRTNTMNSLRSSRFVRTVSMCMAILLPKTKEKKYV